MRDGMVEVRESYFKLEDGTIVQRTQIGKYVTWRYPAPFVFIDWAADVPWDLVRKPATALVKEAPKAMVLYGK